MGVYFGPQFPEPTNGLVFRLDADRVDSYPGSGNNWYDISGYNNHGILTNGPIYVNNGGIYFDGVDDYVSTSFRVSGPPVTIVVACFTRWIDLFDALFFSYDEVDPNSTLMGINVTYNNKIGYHWGQFSTYFDWSGGPVWPTNVFALIALSIDTNQAKTYAVYNDTFYNSDSPNNTFHAFRSSQTNGQMNVGKDRRFPTGGRAFDGTVYEVSVYNRILSEQELFNIYKIRKGLYAV